MSDYIFSDDEETKEENPLTEEDGEATGVDEAETLSEDTDEGTYPYSMSELNENHIEFFKDNDTATIYFTKRKYINRIKKLKEEHPDEVVIESDTKSDILAKVPVSWIKIAPPRHVDLTDEQREELKRRFKKAKEHATS